MVIWGKFGNLENIWEKGWQLGKQFEAQINIGTLEKKMGYLKKEIENLEIRKNIGNLENLKLEIVNWILDLT